MGKIKISKITYRIIALICVMVIFAGSWRGLRFLLTNDVESYTRVMMHEFYNQENIDILFSGASLCYRSFDTEVLDHELGLNTFNAGSSSQDIDASYCLIKDCISRYDVEHIYLELGPIMANNMDIEERTPSTMTGTYIVMDYMKPSMDKLTYMLNATDSQYYIESFLVARRSWKNLFSFENIKKNIQGKTSKEYKEYRYDNLRHENEWYSGKGYVECDTQVREHSFNDSYGMEHICVSEIKEEWFEYLDKIIKYCDRNNVKLTLVCVPVSMYLLSIYGDNYDRYHLELEKIADEHNIEYWDFSLCKEDFFPIDAVYYKDSAHLNMYGAELFSKLFARIVNDEIKYEDVVYHTVEEKLKSLPAGIYGIKKDGSKMDIVANKRADMEFEIEIINENEEKITIQEFEDNSSVEIPENLQGTIHITGRLKKDRTKIEECWL